uniref:E3 ubiquitin-protein ligase CHFR n=1 Tax=Gadus morhua TaxID=8049 RepID=A0A8C5BT51_GADMO
MITKGVHREHVWRILSSFLIALRTPNNIILSWLGCDLSFPANKLVSGEHCKIVQYENSGMVWLEDMSTNGTVINMSKLVKKQLHMVQNGDVIHFVYRKNEPEQSGVVALGGFHARAASPSDLCLSVEPVLLSSAPRDLSREDPQPSTSAALLSAPSGPGPAPSGPAPSGPAPSGPAPSGPAPSGPAPSGPAPSGPAPSGPAPSGPAPSGPAPSGPAPSGPALGLLRDLLGRKALAVEAKTDKMEDSLTCIICQDLLHDCVSLQPCMHTFCSACYSGWMERSSLCPTCRCPVERIRKNHILNNLVEAYLIQHPEKCRSEEDLKGMDSRNKITQDMLQPKVDRSLSDEEGSSDYLFEFSDNDSDWSDNSQPFVVCRQCPGYRKEGAQDPFTTGSNPVQEYRCSPQGSHVICSCCLQAMPDRRSEPGSQQHAVQQCGVCQRPFCHMYWGCERIGCQGCLVRFSGVNLPNKCLDGVLNSNNYESEILQNYLSSRGMSWRDVLQQGLQALEQGAFHLSDYRISGSTVLCYCCGQRTFKELAYRFRQNIPASELPAAVTARPDCYWGRNCRTQVKAHHAVKFNHICEQTRFKS